MRDGLNGFASLRTRPGRPVAPELRRPKRYCSSCGAQLRHSNPGPLCIRCGPRVRIPDWAVALVEFDDRPDSINAVAVALSGIPRDVRLAERNAAMWADWREGRCSKAELAEKYTLARTTVEQILRRQAALAEQKTNER